MATRDRIFPAALAALGLSALALAFHWLAPSSGPAEVAWDRVRCAECGMLVSDPHFAAQLRTEGGEVLFFDDPGCLLTQRTRQSVRAREVWFHDSQGEGWLAEAETVFVPGAASPMGHGFAARSRRAAPGGLDAAAAQALLRARP